jgi:Rhs element Vgr protein
MADPIPSTSSGLVTFTIKINEEAIPEDVGVLSVVVTKEINKIPAATVFIQDGSASKQDFEVSNQKLFIPGNEIEILSGYQGQDATIFKGLIIKHGIKIRSGVSMLIIECKDKFVKLTIGQKSKYFIDKKDSEAIEELIDTYGLEKEIQPTTVQHKDLVQFGTTDWDFILTRAEINGQVCIVEDGKIILKSPSLEGETLKTFSYGDSILDFDATIDARDQYQAVKAAAWDPSTQELLEVDAADPGIAGNGNLSPADLASVIGLEYFMLSHTGRLEQAELQAWADAQLLKKQLAKSRGRVGFMGSSEIKPGDLIQLEGLGERMNGKVYVSGVRHEIGSGTWRTDAQFGLSPDWFNEKHGAQPMPVPGFMPTMQGLQIGVVTQLQEDPDGEDRIMVQLPIISHDEPGIWARLAALDAGNNRGSVFRPELGDEVVVGFLNNDPREPVILGGLHSSSKPSPIPGDDENHEKGFVSRSEMRLIFNDDKKSLTLQSPGGKSIVMDEDVGTLKLEDENGNKIIMNADGITIESSKKIVLKSNDDIEVEGKDIKHTATANFKADGTAGIELTSSAIAKLKGSLVQIN